MSHLFKELQCLFGIPVGYILIWPVTQRFTSNSYRPEIGKVGFQQRLDISPQNVPLHHHRVSACEEHIRHFRVIPKIADQLVCLPHSKLVLIHSHKLRPAEAKRAVGMTGLALAREEKYRFTIFMLE